MSETFQVAVIGILFVFLAFLVAVVVFMDHDNPAQIIGAVLGPVTGVVGTLAGYVAGQSAGARGREQAEQRAAIAQKQLVAMAAPEALAKTRELFPEFFEGPASKEKPNGD